MQSNTVVGILALVCMVVTAALAYFGAVVIGQREKQARRRIEKESSRLALSLHPAYQRKVANDRAYALSLQRMEVERQEAALKRYVALHYVPAETYIVNAQISSMTALPSLKAPKYAPSSSEMLAPCASIQAMTLTQQLRGEQTRPMEEESILGYSSGGPRRGPWNKLHSFFVVGGSGSGKSSTVAYYAALGVLHGARLLIIDPDSEFEESITNRMAALSPFLLCPVGTDPRSAKRVIEVAETESEQPGPYPVIFIVDEFSTIMRHGQTGGGEWKDVASPLAAVLEEYGQRGRKRKRTCILIGQIAKATRTGGTELRESMTATFVHRIKPQQARLVLDSDEAEQCQYLVPGEAMILLSNAVETYRMRIPYADQESMHLVADMMQPHGESEPKVSWHTTGDLVEPVSNLARTSLEPSHELAWEAKVRKVDEMRRSGRTQQQIIYQIWGATKGSSALYVQARQEYQQIIAWLNETKEEGR